MTTHPKNIIWNIEPHIGAGPLKFGMTPEEVAAILGLVRKKNTIKSSAIFDLKDAKSSEEKKLFKQINDLRNNSHKEISYDKNEKVLPILHYRYGKLTEIDFEPNHTLKLDDYRISFSQKKREEILQHFLKLDNDAWAKHTNAVFKTLGINLSTPKYARDSDRNICVFAKGAFDLTLKYTEAEPFKSMADL